MLDNAARKSASSSDLSVCHVEQLYTDAQRSTARARLVLDASTRVAVAAARGHIDLHVHCVVDHADVGCRSHA